MVLDKCWMKHVTRDKASDLIRRLLLDVAPLREVCLFDHIHSIRK
jgi:hypothetical protein